MKVLKFNYATLAFAVAVLTGSIAHSAKTAESGQSTFPKPATVTNESMAPSIGVTMGLSAPEGTLGNASSFGFSAGYQPYIPVGLGMDISFSRHVNENNEERRRTTVLARGTYNFGGSIPVIKNSFAGVGIGPVFLHDGTESAVTPLLGFDIPLTQADHYFLSLGAETKYVIINGSAPDALAINGVLKYWY